MFEKGTKKGKEGEKGALRFVPPFITTDSCFVFVFGVRDSRCEGGRIQGHTCLDNKGQKVKNTKRPFVLGSYIRWFGTLETRDHNYAWLEG